MSLWYPHTIGKINDNWFWVIHPLLPEVFTYGEPCEEDSDWGTVTWWNGPFKSEDEAIDSMSDHQGNAGSYETLPDQIPKALIEQMTVDRKARRYW